MRPLRLMCATMVIVAMAGEAGAQDLKTPLQLTHFVLEPGEAIAELEDLRYWSFGLGVVIGSTNQSTYGLAAHAAYGGPYWYLAGGAGMWNAGDAAADERGFGLVYHYNVFQSRDRRTRFGPQFGWSNVFQSRDRRTRFGPQFGWSTLGLRDGRTRAFDLRAVGSHAFSESFSWYGGLGMESRRFSLSGRSTRSIDPSLLMGVSTKLTDRIALATGVESVLSDSSQLTLAAAVQFDAADDGSESTRGR